LKLLGNQVTEHLKSLLVFLLGKNLPKLIQGYPTVLSPSRRKRAAFESRNMNLLLERTRGKLDTTPRASKKRRWILTGIRPRVDADQIP
jgi:hypothetical protein